jgi:hypothetical protein
VEKGEASRAVGALEIHATAEWVGWSADALVILAFHSVCGSQVLLFQQLNSKK